MIRSFFKASDADVDDVNPLAKNRASTMTALGEDLDVLIDANGVTWAKVSKLLSIYGIPYLWDADKRRILLGATDILPRYCEDMVAPKPGLATFELALQGGNSPVILVGLIHQNEAYCRVLEFADELGVSASFDPFALHQRRGG